MKLALALGYIARAPPIPGSGRTDSGASQQPSQETLTQHPLFLSQQKSAKTFLELFSPIASYKGDFNSPKKTK